MSAGPVVAVDSAKLWRAVAYRLFRTHKTAREVALLLGFSPQVLSDLKAHATGTGYRKRKRGGYQPGSSIFLTLCWWLDADPREFQQVRPDLPPIAEVDKVLMEAQ